ncbi:MAG TPA: ROK family protein, partial [Ktedonobacteraceae bacterium]|nr:ROK family protein [Ktedonobacteraceae bacterium]
TGSAGEIGHMTIELQGPLCSCGKRGCLEALAGALAIVAEAQQGTSRALTEGQGTSSAHAQLEMIDVGQVARAAQAGDLACKKALEHAGVYIGIALASLMSALNPSLILLDGSIMRAGALLLEPIRLSVAAYSLPSL